MLEHQHDNRMQDAEPTEQGAVIEHKREQPAVKTDREQAAEHMAAAEATEAETVSAAEMSLAQAEEEAIILAQKLAAYAAELLEEEQLQNSGRSAVQEQNIFAEREAQQPSRIYRLVCLICGALSLLGFVVFLINCLVADKIVDSVAKIQGYLITIALFGLGISLVEIGLRK